MRKIKYSSTMFYQQALGGILIIMIVGGFLAILGRNSHFLFQTVLWGVFFTFLYFFGKKLIPFLKEGKNSTLMMIDEFGIKSNINEPEQSPFEYKWTEISRAIYKREYLLKETRIVEIEFRGIEGSGKKNHTFIWNENMDISINEFTSWLDHYGVNIDNLIRGENNISKIKKENMPFTVEEALFGESNVPIYKKTKTEKISAIHIDFYTTREPFLSDGTRMSEKQKEMMDFDKEPALVGEIIDVDPSFKEKSRQRYREASESAEEAKFEIITLVDDSENKRKKR